MKKRLKALDVRDAQFVVLRYHALVVSKNEFNNFVVYRLGKVILQFRNAKSVCAPVVSIVIHAVKFLLEEKKGLSISS